MQILSQVSTEAILALCKRPEPGTPFSFGPGVTGMKVLGAINMGQITYDFAAASFMNLIDNVEMLVQTPPRHRLRSTVEFWNLSRARLRVRRQPLLILALCRICGPRFRSL